MIVKNIFYTDKIIMTHYYHIGLGGISRIVEGEFISYVKYTTIPYTIKTTKIKENPKTEINIFNLIKKQ